MPNIVLKEQDLTTVAVAEESTDVVFIPGIADTNFNCYICNVPDITPTNKALSLTPSAFVSGDTIHHKKDGSYGAPSIFVNTFDKKAWKCTNTTGPVWEAIDYVAVSPTNQPTYVDSLIEFTTKFGKEAYTWKVANYADATAFDKARELPKFKENELPGDADAPHYFYNQGDIEKSWLYAKEMIYAGLPIFFEDVATLTNVGTEEVPVYQKELPVLTDFYAALASTLTGRPDEEGYDGTHGVYANYEILDVGEYNFKYVTSGVYPVFNSLEDATDSRIVDRMMKLCTKRGDSYALIDHADNVLRPWYGTKSLFNAVQNASIGDMGSRAAMFTPWATYSMNTATLVTLMPASFGYLRTIANGIKTYNNYFAYAGVNRGEVPGIKELHCMYPLTNTVANDIQTKSGYSINPITFVKPYGLTIWGNRTLLKADDGLKALNFLNIRNLVCEVQKTAYDAAKVCLFENDNLGTWVKFVAPINALLQSMQDAGSLKAFLVSRAPATERAVINVEIRIVPTYAVEEFNITVILLDDGEISVEVE